MTPFPSCNPSTTRPTSSRARCCNCTASMDGLEAAVRSVLSDIDPNLTLLGIQTLQEQVDSRLRPAARRRPDDRPVRHSRPHPRRRRPLRSHRLHRRTPHQRNRRADGARRKPRQRHRLVLRGAFPRSSSASLIGIPVSIGCSRLIAAQLYQVKGWDPLVLGGSVLALAVCALVASIIPAQRAASINPVKALRTE